MLRDLYWYDLCIRLRDYLRSYRTKEGKRIFDFIVDREDLKIRVGIGNSGEYPALYIDFGQETTTKKQGSITAGEVILYLDLLLKGEAEENVADYDDIVYRQMYLCEKELVQALEGFRAHLHESGMGINMNLEAILSDGGENAPVVVAQRMVVSLEWQKATSKPL